VTSGPTAGSAVLAAPSSPATPTGPPAKPKPAWSANVLILDDEKALAGMLEQIVHHLGHHCSLFFSPAEALKELQQHDFDLIFSDYRMPELDGRQFYQQVSRIKPHLTPRIVFLTGDVANEETQAFLASIKNAHITKPFNLGAVRGVIDSALQGKPPAESSPPSHQN
jgi:CheY-like chemotaxis protein